MPWCYTHQMPELKPRKQSLLERDLKWLAHNAAKIGFVLAILCHAVPPHYRVLCDHIAHLCYGGSS